MSIRFALPSDTNAIAALHADSWNISYRGALSDEYLAGDIIAERQALWEQRLRKAPSNQIVVVATRDSELLGFACVYLNDNPKWGSLLDNMPVSKRAHRKGIGSALLHTVADYCAASSPMAGLYLLVVQSNFSAEKFYQSHGARNVGADVWNAPDGTQVPRYIYAWPADQLPN